AVRFRLVDARLQSAFDSMDICQSVMGSFFVRTAAGQFDLQSPQELLNLLITMARNKLADHARAEHAARRDIRRVAGGNEDVAAVAAQDPSPSRAMAAH